MGLRSESRVSGSLAAGALQPRPLLAWGMEGGRDSERMGESKEGREKGSESGS